MKKIVSAIAVIVMILYGSQLFVSNTNAEYYITYRSKNVLEIDKAKRTSFYLTNDTTTTEVAIPDVNEDGKIYTSVNILWCSALKKISLGKNVCYIHIEDCQNLTEVHIDNANPYFMEVDDVIYNAEMTELLFYSRSKKDGSFTVPDTVETICDYAFSGNQYLEEIILSERTITLGQYTFSNCNLTKAELPHSLEKIGSHCFDLNPKISDIIIPKNITRLDYVFENCEALETITFLNADNIYEPLSSVGGNHLFAYKNIFGNRINPVVAYVPDNQIDQYIQMAEDGWKCEYEIRPLSWKQISDPQPTGIAGDVNCDGCYNIADLVIVSRWILNSVDSASINVNDPSACDVDHDGFVDLLDLMLLRKTLISQ